MRRIALVPATLVLAAMLAAPAAAEMLSKTYEFKSGVTLEVGATTDDGLRIDSVRIELPAASEGRLLRTGGLLRAQVAISNTSIRSRKVGLAMALFDAGGRLLGVASGGTKLWPIKSDRQRTYDLIFEHVNDEASAARTFQISVESKN